MKTRKKKYFKYLIQTGFPETGDLYRIPLIYVIIQPLERWFLIVICNNNHKVNIVILFHQILLNGDKFHE